ncbi:MAG: Maf-like protein [Gammaproteobacteria bacterium]|nr:Maf-like protein [Gammaproteobacteria bacterium]MDH3560565.1 Maf-like protein [Gammaproteobacteria bacterium]
MNSSADLFLASSSPRRRDLLAQLGIRFTLLPIEIDEAHRPGEAAAAYVRRLALDKARAGWASLGKSPARPVLGADTAVVIDGEIMGKPQDRIHGLEMLQRLSGRSHQVQSAVALVGHHEAVRVNCSSVTFRTLSPAECEAYWATGEPRDKAGGYAIQGLAATFITRLEGSYSGVMGLPLYETAELLQEFAINVL